MKSLAVDVLFQTDNYFRKQRGSMAPNGEGTDDSRPLRKKYPSGVDPST